MAPMPSQPACSASTTALIVSTPTWGWKTGIGGGSVTDAPQESVGRAREQQLGRDAGIDLEALRARQVLPYRGLRIVALAPRAPGEELVGQVLDERVEHD